MDNRYTPFGYHVEDGAISIAETEAAIIRQIFSDYIGGKSLKEIAAELTVRKVEYLTVNRKIVMELVSQIKLISDEEIEITLINGQVLRKENPDGDNSTIE